MGKMQMKFATGRLIVLLNKTDKLLYQVGPFYFQTYFQTWTVKKQYLFSVL